MTGPSSARSSSPTFAGLGYGRAASCSSSRASRASRADKNTSLRLAEARSGLRLPRLANGAPLLVDGERRWVTFDEPAVDDGDFVAVGAALAASGGQRTGTVGEAGAALRSRPELVAFAARWFAGNRQVG